MNAPSLNDLRRAAEREVRDEKMDQIRELLIGDGLRALEARIATLENRIGELEVGISRQLDAVESRIDQFAGATRGEQREAFEALASSVADLGERIRRISKG